MTYLTCDDFQPDACASCLRQKYPEDAFRVLICDDSRDPERRARVDTFVLENPRAVVVRRGDRRG